MDKKKKIIISIIAGSVVVSSAVGISLGIYFSKVKKPEPPVSKLILNTFYFLNRDESRINWEIDVLDYKVEFINQSVNNSSRLSFSVDNPQGFYNDCISPYISSFLTEYTIEGKKIKLFFYDKAPIYYLEDNGVVSITSYGGSKMGYSYLLPFFAEPYVNYGVPPITYSYPSKSVDWQRQRPIFLGEFGSYIKLENFNDAQNLFIKHLDSSSFLINEEEKSITSFAYNSVEVYYVGSERYVYCGFDKNVYVKYIFNDEEIGFSFYDKYYEDTINNPTTK